RYTTLQGKLRPIIAFGGFAASIVLMILVVSAIIGSTALMLVGGFLGILMIVMGCIVILRMEKRFSSSQNVSSTRLGNIEKRMAGQDFSALDEPLDQVLSRVAAVERRQIEFNNHIVGIRQQLKVLRNRVPAGYMLPVQEELIVLKEE